MNNEFFRLTGKERLDNEHFRIMGKKRIGNEYFRITGKERIGNGFGIVIALLAISQLFYDNFIMALVLAPIGVVIYKKRTASICQSKADYLERGFKDFLISVSDGMNTGYSMENAIKESYRDLLPVYGYDSAICNEVRLMKSRIKLNVNVETIIEDFANRCQLKSVLQFAHIFSVAKKTGGNMTKVIKSITDDIVLKQSVKEEVSTLIHSKKLEQRIMSAIPLLLLVYIKYASPGFLDVMYETIMGNIIMTIGMILYGVAIIWSEKIVELNV